MFDPTVIDRSQQMIPMLLLWRTRPTYYLQKYKEMDQVLEQSKNRDALLLEKK